MHPSLALLAPLALLVPTLGADRTVPDEAELLPQPSPAPVAVGEALTMVDPTEDPLANQVRIEQRVTIRIAPRDPAIRPSMLPEMSLTAPPRVIERKIGKCVPVSGIAAVQPDGGRLLLFMRDQRLVAASLEKACRARDFYRGFYLERTGDGLLCIERDKLHSRAGASCEVSKIRQLVNVDD
ncbi:hypothetical protein ACWPM1_04420 [Tsuneonella sp. HG249]